MSRNRPIRSLLRNARTLLVALGLTLAACEPGARADGGTWTPEVIARFPHDPNAFTQGLVFHDGKLYESTGRYGESSLRRVELETGRVERLAPLDSRVFGEGLTLLDERLFQLTWRSEIGYVYALGDFRPIGQFRYDGEGWGLTHDGERLILSDGTATLRFLDPDDFRVLDTITVRDGETEIANLNELEYIDDEIWANIWYDERIVRIDPATGRVLGYIDLAGLYPAAQRPSDAVVNGIAWDPGSDRLFVTGKLWPAIFEIRLSERD